MSKARSAVKYTAAGALTTVYGLAAYRMMTKKYTPAELTPVQAGVTVSSLIGLTWLATTL